MNKKRVSQLLERYLFYHNKGKEVYFDADEIVELLDSFDESDDFTYYDEVLALGLKLHPYNAELQIRKCQSLILEEDYKKALSLINTITNADAEDLDVLRLECYAMLYKYDKVVERIEQLINEECDYLDFLFEQIAPILSERDMIKEAHDFVNRGLLLFPDNISLKNELCYILEIEGDIPRAIKICNELVDQVPYSNEYWFTLGRLYSRSEDYEKAVEAFDFALACDDSDNDLKILKAYCLYMNKSYKKAIETYDEIILDNNTFPQVAPLLSDCYIQIEEFEKAYKVLKKLFEDCPLMEDPKLFFNYFLCCFKTERDEDACWFLSKIALSFPEEFTNQTLLTLSFIENQEREKALLSIEKLLQAFDQTKRNSEGSIENLFRTGQSLFVKGNFDQAIQYFHQVLQVNPTKPYIYLYLAMCYLAKKDMENYTKYYQKVSPTEVLSYMQKETTQHEQQSIYISPGDLVKEFLKNKDNNN